MNKSALFFSLCFCAALSAAEPVFYCNFDKTAVPQIAAGDKTPHPVVEPAYDRGIRGDALVVGLDAPHGKRGIRYAREKNLNWDRGTISFWVKPLDWKGSDTGFFAMFFSAVEGRNFFQIYKYITGENLYFLRGELGFWLFAQSRPGEWKCGEWHHVACTWDSVQMQMYVDGHLTTERRIFFPQKDLASKRDFLVGEGPGSTGYNLKTGRKSLIDEFKIYDVVLTPEEIRKIYLSDASGVPPRNLISVPFKKEFSSTGFTDRKTDEYAVEQNLYTVSYDEKYLNIALRKYQKGDCVELTSPAGKKFSFPFRNAAQKIELAGIGLKPHDEGWKINIATGNSDLRGGARLMLDPAAPSMKISGLYDLSENTSAISIPAAPDVEMILDTDTSRNYGFQRIRRKLAEKYTRTGAIADWQLVSLSLNRNGKDFYRTDFTLRKNQPLTVDFVYTKIKERKMLVALHGSGRGKILAEFIQDKKQMAAETVNIPENAPNFFNLLVPVRVKPGEYDVCLYYVGADGNKKQLHKFVYRVPAADDPLVKPYIDPQKDEVPPGGWIPVEADSRQVKIWGRTIRLDEGVIFRSINSQGKELLAEPDVLVMNGKRLVPEKTEMKLLSKNKLEAAYIKKIEYENFDVTGNFTVYFDGYVKIKMTLVPKAPLKVQSLALELPLRNERVRMVRDNDTFSKVTGRAGNDFGVSLLKIPTLWVGDQNAGISFSAENLVNWHCRSKNRHAEMHRDAKAARLSFNLIGSPLTLKAVPREYNFGFVITPVKPLNRYVLRMREKKEMQQTFPAWKFFNRMTTDPDGLQENFAKLYESSRQSFRHVFWYSAFNFTSPFAPENIWYEENWRQIKHNRTCGIYTGIWPGAYCEGCVNGDSYRNFRLNNWAGFIRKDNPLLIPEMRNFYFDAPWEESCYNTSHGCAPWTDSTGMKHSHILVDHLRDMSLNVYRMIKRLDKNALVSYHAEWGKPLPCFSFTDSMMGGEGQEHDVAANNGYFNILTPWSVAATFSPYIYSAKMILIPQVVRGLQLNAPSKYRSYSIRNPMWRKAHLHYMGLCIVNDVDMEERNELSYIMWKAQDELGWDEKTGFFPFYAENPAVRTAPVSDRIVASAYTNNGKIMIAVLNDTDREETVSLDLDFDRLKVKPDLRGYDVWEPAERYVLAEKMTVKLPARGFRLLLFSRTAESLK